ncbi:MAG: SUMF1/EgtB/PvdO family nonheme iron enzyme [Deltaproteobacteria bacterium]|nr:SUMF1/EgtB/PvdO family nonheme iron enzyme [Deltaproteobacteria bacterium]
MKIRSQVALLGVVLAASLPACGSDSSDTQPAAGSGGGDAGSDASTDAAGELDGATGTPCGSFFCGPLEQCFNNQLCTARQVPVTGGYSIDATEVTRDQYNAWLGSKPASAGQPSFCAGNDTFEPDTATQETGCAPSTMPSGTQGNYPVVCVDWCDAFAYCKAIGKRLCGKIGGGANDFGDCANPATSQWFNACSSNGQNDFPYGDTYDGKLCNGNDNAGGSMLPVGSLAGCQSSVAGFEGVYDLSGNVLEWEDSCDAANGAQDLCHNRAGASFNTPDYLRCDVDGSDKRGSHNGGIGFRCCSEP